MIITQDFLNKLEACQPAQDFISAHNLWSKTEQEILDAMRAENLTQYIDWWTSQKSTEKFVRANGSVITMGAYQVFNPLTGEHTRYGTEAEAKAALVEVAKAIMSQYPNLVNQEISNENGDTTWIPTNMNESLIIS